MDHLLDFFDRYVPGPSAGLRYDDGFRRWSYSCDQLAGFFRAVCVRSTSSCPARVAFVEEQGEKGRQASAVRIPGKHRYVAP